jgi:hypothetical protein
VLQKDFCNIIGTKRKWHPWLAMSAHRRKADLIRKANGSEFDHPELTSDLSSATDRAGDALGQCEIPLGPKNWLVRLNHQRGVQLGHSSYKFTAVAASDPPQS